MRRAGPAADGLETYADGGAVCVEIPAELDGREVVVAEAVEGWRGVGVGWCWAEEGEEVSLDEGGVFGLLRFGVGCFGHEGVERKGEGLPP